MDKLLLRGEQINSVARRFSVSEDAVGRHKRHMQLVIAKAAALVEQKDVASVSYTHLTLPTILRV